MARRHHSPLSYNRHVTDGQRELIERYTRALWVNARGDYPYNNAEELAAGLVRSETAEAGAGCIESRVEALCRRIIRDLHGLEACNAR